MKNKAFFAALASALSIIFTLSACGTQGGNIDSTRSDGNNRIEYTETIGDGASNNNQTETTPDSNDISDNTDNGNGETPDDPDKTDGPDSGNIHSKDFITDWDTDGIFTTGLSKYEFDFSINDTDFSYEIGSEENEQLFAAILNGEENYKDHLTWFSLNPDYIYRFNEQRYKATGEIIREGAFTQKLRDKYWGLFTSNATYPYFSALGIDTESYQIYFNDDWTIKYIWKLVRLNIRCNSYERWHYNLIGYTLGDYYSTKIDSESAQYDEFIDPLYEEQRLVGYTVTFASLNLSVDMGDGKKADCSVDVTYKPEIVTGTVWNGQKQTHEEVTYISNCRVTADDNNVYSGGVAMFDTILIFTKHTGCWDLNKVWQRFREEALTPSLDLYELSEQKVYRLA